MVAAKQLEADNITHVQPSGLPAKMVAIMRDVGNISKSGRNKEQNYAYIKGDDVVDSVRTAMVAHNVALFSRAIEYDQQAGTTSTGKTNWHIVVKFEFTLVDADTGEQRADTWFGEAIDMSDKSMTKAASMALKYWLMKTFMISAGEDNDGESPTFERQQRSARQAVHGNGQQERRIPAKTDEKASNSSAAGKPAKTPPVAKDNAPKDGMVKTFTVNQFRPRQKDGKTRWQLEATDNTVLWAYSRDIFRAIGYTDDQMEGWGKIGYVGSFGKDYEIQAKWIATDNGGYWNVIVPDPENMPF